MRSDPLRCAALRIAAHTPSTSHSPSDTLRVDPGLRSLAANKWLFVHHPLQLRTEGDRPRPSRDASGSDAIDSGHKSIMIRFAHGLGDAVQLTAVLRHLRSRFPSWDVDVAGVVDKHSCWGGLCRSTTPLTDQSTGVQYDKVYTLDWPECREIYADSQSTKMARCLREVFGIHPDPALSRYEIQVSEQREVAAARWLDKLPCGPPRSDGRLPVVFLHYEGNTSRKSKDLPHDVALRICKAIQEVSYVPVIFDWDERSPLPNDRDIFCPGATDPLWEGKGTGDGATLAALMQRGSLVIAIDSGPLHVAGATSTPTLGVWTRYHPIHFFDPCPNVLHLIPDDQEGGGTSDPLLRFFIEHYAHRTYRHLSSELPNLVTKILARGPFDSRLHGLKSRHFDQGYYEEHKSSGLDYSQYGDWQRSYGNWIVESLMWNGRRVLDVGCACGSLVNGLREAGAIPQGVDLNQHAILLGRHRWPKIASQLHVCDAVNLHLFDEESFEGIHSAQVAEHWKPDLVPHILRELHRVTFRGGLFYCCLDTLEVAARQARDLRREDPTHACIRSLTWWHQQLESAGWEVCSAELAASLEDHPRSFFKHHDWDWFAARRR